MAKDLMLNLGAYRPLPTDTLRIKNCIIIHRNNHILK